MPEDVPVKGLRRVELRSNDPAGVGRALPEPVRLDRHAGRRRHPEMLGRRPVGRPDPKTRRLGDPGLDPVLGGRPTALLADPAGVTATLDPGRVRHGPWAPPPRHGEPCWLELMTADTTDDYWAAQLGWTLRADTDVKPFALFDAPDDAGTRCRRRPRLARRPGHRRVLGACWMCYLAATDITLVTETAVAGGATLLIEPREAPAGVIAAIADPYGTVCTLLEDPAGWAEPGRPDNRIRARAVRAGRRRGPPHRPRHHRPAAQPMVWRIQSA